MEKLGANLHPDELKVTLDILNVKGKPILCTLDAVHLIKLIRNAFGDYGEFKNANGDRISWSYIEKLHFLQLREGAHCANKFTQKHMDWKKDPMKVSYATQTLSKSLAASIAFLRDDLKLSEFSGSEATCEFLLVFNDLFDVLNSKSKYGKFLKGPLSESSHKYWKPVLDNARKYILGLRHSTGNKRLVNGPRK